MTDYELAKLRLRAFKLFDGWGTTDEKGNFKTYNLKERKERALDFVDWALSSTKEPKA